MPSPQQVGVLEGVVDTVLEEEGEGVAETLEVRELVGETLEESETEEVELGLEEVIVGVAEGVV